MYRGIKTKNKADYHIFFYKKQCKKAASNIQEKKNVNLKFYTRGKKSFKDKGKTDFFSHTRATTLSH